MVTALMLDDSHYKFEVLREPTRALYQPFEIKVEIKYVGKDPIVHPQYSEVSRGCTAVSEISSTLVNGRFSDVTELGVVVASTLQDINPDFIRTKTGYDNETGQVYVDVSFQDRMERSYMKLGVTTKGITTLERDVLRLNQAEAGRLMRGLAFLDHRVEYVPQHGKQHPHHHPEPIKKGNE